MYQGAARNGRRPERPSTRAGWGACLSIFKSFKAVIDLVLEDSRFAGVVER